MKKIVLFLALLASSCYVFGQTYNITTVDGISTQLDTVPKGTPFGIYTYITNNSTAPVSNITFKWYISTDSVLSSGDALIDQFVAFEGTDADDPLGAGKSANVWSVFANIPTSFADGCNYYLIQNFTSNYPETNYKDNTAYMKICVRSKRVDLTANVSLSSTTFFRNVNNTQIVLNEHIGNDGELAHSQSINYLVKIGTSPDHTLGNIYTKPQVHTTAIAATSSASMKDTFDISTLPLGDYYVFHMVDPGNLIAEPKKNNVAVERFRIADLTVTEGEVAMPQLDTVKYISTCNSVIYDDGGLLGNYSPNGNSTLYIYPSQANARVRLSVKSSSLYDQDYFWMGYSTPFSSFSQTTYYNTTTLFEDYLTYNSQGIAYIRFKSDADKQAAGFKIEAKCSYGFDYRALSIQPSKPVFINPYDTVLFTAKLKNIGFQSIPSLKYQYGIARTTSLNTVVFASTIGTTGAIPSNSNDNSSVVTLSNIKIPLHTLAIKDTGTYYLFLKTGVGQNDTDTTDNLIFQPIKIFKTDTISNQSVNFSRAPKYITTCNMSLYDDGGPSANYSNNFNGKVYLFPAEPDKIIKLQASDLQANLERNSSFTSFLDYLTFNNPITEALDYTLSFMDDHTYIASKFSSRGTMVQFTSNAANNLPGFKYNVTCAYKGLDYMIEKFDITNTQAFMGTTTSLAYKVRLNNNGNTPNPSGNSPWILYVSPTKNTSDALYSSSRTRGFYNTTYSEDTVRLMSITKPGYYYFIAVLDPNNTYTEVTKANNVAIDSVYIDYDYADRIPVTGTKILTTCNDTITDIVGDRGNYLNNLNGTIILKPAGTGQKVKISFLAFDTESDKDLVSIYNGTSTNSPLIGTYSGTTLPPDILAKNSTGSLTISFITNGSVTKGGFSFKTSCEAFTRADLPITGTQTITTCKGEIYDNGGPDNNYANRANGVMTIFPAETGKYVNLQFEGFAFSNDFLEIFDGPNTNAPLLNTFAEGGHNFPMNVKATSKNSTGALTLRLKTDASGVHNGFTAWSTCETDPQKEILFPLYGNRKITTCGDTLYDSGGSKDDTFNPTESSITLYPQNGSERVKVDFLTFDVLSGYKIVIYDGDTTTSPIIASYSYTNLPQDAIVATNPKGALTVKYTNKSYGYSTDNFSLKTSCVPNATFLFPSKDSSATLCGKVLLDNGGASGNYGHNLNYSLTVYPLVADKKMSISASSFSLHKTDTLYIYDGTGTNAPLMGKFTGNQELSLLTASNENTSGALTLRMRSDNSLSSSGFSLFLFCSDSVNGITVPARGIKSITTCSTTVHDIHGEAINYRNNMDGALTILPVNSNEKVKITFTAFDTEQDHDFVYVYDGTTTSAPVLGPYSGNTIPAEITAQNTSGALTVRFVTDSAFVKPGFQFKTSCIKPTFLVPMTGTTTITTCNGIIYDHSGTSNYAINANGTLIIYPDDPTKKVKLTFTSFSTETSYDFLKIYDGINTSSAPILNHSGSTLPTPRMATNDKGALVLNFASDNTGVGMGFVATLSCETPIPLSVSNELKEEQGQFMVIPNPAHDKLEINKEGQKMIYSAEGRLMISSLEQIVDISNLPSGMYQIVNLHQGQKHTKTFIKY